MCVSIVYNYIDKHLDMNLEKRDSLNRDKFNDNNVGREYERYREGDRVTDKKFEIKFVNDKNIFYEKEISTENDKTNEKKNDVKFSFLLNNNVIWMSVWFCSWLIFFFFLSFRFRHIYWRIYVCFFV